jgi:hypothetical protein
MWHNDAREDGSMFIDTSHKTVNKYISHEDQYCISSSLLHCHPRVAFKYVIVKTLKYLRRCMFA